MAGAEAFPMMHHHGGQLVQEVLGPRRARGTGAGHAPRRRLAAAVRLHVEQLVEADVHSDLLPVVPPRPPDGQSERRDTVT